MVTSHFVNAVKSSADRILPDHYLAQRPYQIRQLQKALCKDTIIIDILKENKSLKEEMKRIFEIEEGHDYPGAAPVKTYNKSFREEIEDTASKLNSESNPVDEGAEAEAHELSDLNSLLSEAKERASFDQDI